MNDTTPLMTAAECAREIGMTVRALRVYEDHGLLSPQRSAKNWRLYGAREVSRLNEILTFKAMGFNLARITELLSGHESATDDMLALQQARLTDHRKRLAATALAFCLRFRGRRRCALHTCDDSSRPVPKRAARRCADHTGCVSLHARCRDWPVLRGRYP